MFRNCLVCTKEFHTIPAKVKVGKGKFCSKICYLIDHSKNTWSKGVCKGCKKEFQYHTYRKQTCCSLSCNAKYRLDKNNERTLFLKPCNQCQKEFLTKPERIKSGRGKYCSRDCYAVWMSENRLGEQVASWRGGITPLYRKIRVLKKYRDWSKIIYARDKVCTQCFTSNVLEIDHFPLGFAQIILEKKITTTQEAILCTELWDTNNGRVICRPCHTKTASYGYHGKSIKFTQKK